MADANGSLENTKGGKFPNNFYDYHQQFVAPLKDAVDKTDPEKVQSYVDGRVQTLQATITTQQEQINSLLKDNGKLESRLEQLEKRIPVPQQSIAAPQ